MLSAQDSSEIVRLLHVDTAVEGCMKCSSSPGNFCVIEECRNQQRGTCCLLLANISHRLVHKCFVIVNVVKYIVLCTYVAIYNY